MEYIIQYWKEQWKTIRSEGVDSNAKAVERAKAVALAKGTKTRVLLETWSSDEKVSADIKGNYHVEK